MADIDLQPITGVPPWSLILGFSLAGSVAFLAALTLRARARENRTRSLESVIFFVASVAAFWIAASMYYDMPGW